MTKRTRRNHAPPFKTKMALAALKARIRRIPSWLLLPARAITIAWHGSLRHEAIYRHPTRLPWAQRDFGVSARNCACPWRATGIPIWRTTPLWNSPPRRTVLRQNIFFPAQCVRLGTAGRLAAAANATLLCRLLFGPAVGISGFLVPDLRDISRGEQAQRRYWAVHLAGVAALLAWLTSPSHMNPLRYILCFAYPRQSLALVRSFAEVHVAPGPSCAG